MPRLTLGLALATLALLLSCGAPLGPAGFYAIAADGMGSSDIGLLYHP